jgi:chromosome segregation ATPase
VWVGADHIQDLPSIREKYESAVGATVSVGLGLSIAEADKALLSSKLNGKDRITFYTPAVDAEIRELQNKEPKEDDKIFKEYLGKAEHPLKAQFDKIIQEKQDAERAKSEQQAQANEKTQVKAAVVQILQQVKSNAKELEALKEESPHLYESIMQMTNALIMLARQLKEQGPSPAQPASTELSKSQKASKAKHFVMNFPVGFLLPPGSGRKREDGRIKIETKDGKIKWRAIRSGMIMDDEGNPTSSRGSES